MTGGSEGTIPASLCSDSTSIFSFFAAVRWIIRARSTGSTVLRTLNDHKPNGSGTPFLLGLIHRQAGVRPPYIRGCQYMSIMAT
ncbi:hypothetical protein BJQ90_00275 [Arthrobacter sp. SO3]|nr:hypothetical protein [Arthrobacter sp. SO3]